MMKKFYIIFFSFFLTAIHAMEPQKELTVVKEKNRKEKDKKSIFHRKSSQKSVSLSSINEKKEIYNEHALITAARNKDHNTIKFHLSNRYFNPNVQNLELNTPLHYAAENGDSIAIQLFLNDPRIDASIKNVNNRTARDLVDISIINSLIDTAKTKNPSLEKLENLDPSNAITPLKNEEGVTELITLMDQKNQLLERRRTIFARASLDIITAQECATIKPTYQNGLITAGLINETIQKIKAKIRAIEEKQITQHNSEDCGDLPPSALLPQYATDEFMRDMVFFRLSLDAVNSAWLK
jgi:hypothetical protein